LRTGFQMHKSNLVSQPHSSLLKLKHASHVQRNSDNLCTITCLDIFPYLVCNQSALINKT